MRWSIVPVCLLACTPRPEADCADALDNDGDGAVDCYDADCATATCDTDAADTDPPDVPDTDDTDGPGDTDADTDVVDTDVVDTDVVDTDVVDTDVVDTDTGPVEVCGDFGGDDEDGDGAANCADSDCFSDLDCDEWVVSVEFGDAAVGDTTFSGAGSQGWYAYDPAPPSLLAPSVAWCEVGFHMGGTEHAASADCVGCEFAFQVTFRDTTAATGTTCDGVFDVTGRNLDGFQYGYGYHAAYEYDGVLLPSMMYYRRSTGYWVRAPADVRRTADRFEYAFRLSDVYYY